jgi:integrase
LKRHQWGGHRKFKQLLGHSDVRMTMRYAHVIQTDKADAVAMLDE